MAKASFLENNVPDKHKYSIKQPSNYKAKVSDLLGMQNFVNIYILNISALQLEKDCHYKQYAYTV